MVSNGADISFKASTPARVDRSNATVDEYKSCMGVLVVAVAVGRTPMAATRVWIALVNAVSCAADVTDPDILRVRLVCSDSESCCGRVRPDRSPIPLDLLDGPPEMVNY